MLSEVFSNLAPLRRRKSESVFRKFLDACFPSLSRKSAALKLLGNLCDLDQPHLHPILRQILLEFLNIYFLPVENTRRQSRVDLRILEEV